MKWLLCVCLCLLLLTAPILAVEEVPDQTPTPEEPPIKCEDTNNDDTSVLPPDDTSNDKYPVGSYVDADGNVWSSDYVYLDSCGSA